MGKIQMADAEYRGLDRVSYSSLKHIRISVAEFLHQKEKPFEGNDASNLGTAIHNWLQGRKDLVHFEPDLSHIKTKEGKIAKNPSMTDEGKAILKDIRAKVPHDAVLVPFDAKKKLERIEKNFRADPRIAPLFAEEHEFEAPYLGTIFGVPYKGKLDMKLKNRKVIIDFKTTSKSIVPEAFIPRIDYDDYDFQAGGYIEMVAEDEGCSVWDYQYLIIAISTNEPHDIEVYELSEETKTRGLNKLAYSLDKYRTHIMEGNPEIKKVHTA